MKTSLNSKSVILALSAVLVLSATGCERRGRAPAKPTNDAKTSPTGPGVTANPNEAPKTEEGKPTSEQGKTASTEEKKDAPVNSADEATLLANSKLDCAGESIDVTGKVSKDSFAKDLFAIHTFNGCIHAAGISLLVDKKATGNEWSVDKEMAKKTYNALAAEVAVDSDPYATKILSARLELAIVRLGKFTAKYDVKALEGSDLAMTDTVNYMQGKNAHVETTLSDLSKGVIALESFRPELKAMASINDGADENEAKTDEDGSEE